MRFGGRFGGMMLAAAMALAVAAPAEARRSAMSNTPEIALVADLPDDSRFEAYGSDGKTVTLDLGWSYREFSALWMPFAAWKEHGLVFYSRGADGQTNLAPATRRELSAIKALTGVDYETDYAFPYWQYLWGWIPLTLVIALVFWRRHVEQKRKDAQGIM
jgi:hypothetical protein